MDGALSTALVADLATLFWAQAIGVLPLIFLLIASPDVPYVGNTDAVKLVLFGVVSALSYLLLYHGFGKGEVSLLSPIFASYAAVVVILSVIFFNEVLGLGRAAAIIVVFAGILLISTNPRDVRRLLHEKTVRTKGVPEVLVAMLAYSLWLVIFDRYINGKAWVFYVLFIRIVAAITLAVFALARSRGLAVKNRSIWKYLVAIGVCDVAAYSFVAYGFSHTSYLSIVAVLSATFSVPTIILAHIFLKEKATRIQAVAITIIIVGVALISAL
jgi:drug/metabolite transporter (DMT)-like permease